MGRSLNTISAFLLLIIPFSLYSCNGEQACFTPPLLVDARGLGAQVDLDTDALQMDSSRDASFASSGRFTGHVFGVSGETTIDTSLLASSGSAAPALALYGPRTNTGLFGRPIAYTCGEKGTESRLDALRLEQAGDYLIITADPSETGGGYSLSLSCSAGCDQPECQPLVCELYCPAGLVPDADGCRLCECAGCMDHADCPREFLCVNGTCLRKDPCDCDDHPYAPVCGSNGITYPNSCELDCAGVELAHEGECPPPGECESDADCAAGQVCINGLCQAACDYCQEYGYDPVCGTNGITYFNDCQRQCAGVALDHLGECQQCNPEICDGLDNDCDGTIDEGVCHDCDTDEDCGVREVCENGTCVKIIPCSSDADCPAGQVCVDAVCRIDIGCDPEVCDGIDNDCDGTTDEGCPGCQSDEDCYPGTCNLQTGECEFICEDIDQDGYLGCQNDCDDLDASVYPGAVESCDGIDNDCDGLIDEGFDFLNDPENCGRCGVVCPEGECYMGTCVAGTCTQDPDCDDGDPGTEDHCSRQECVHLAICSADMDCSVGQLCFSGICVGHGTCIEHTDCVAPEQCEPNMGLCVLPCRMDEDCAVGQVCHQVYCAP